MYFIKEHDLTQKLEVTIYGRENLSSKVSEHHLYDADQPTFPRRLISAFVIRVLKSIISELAIDEISIF